MTNLVDVTTLLQSRKVLKDERREFIANDFLRLEILPKPTRNKQQISIDFCEKYLALCAHRVETSSALLETAFAEACRLGLSPIDAIHLAAAHAANADELVTLEKPTKPMYKSGLVKVVYLHDIK